jgi:hypothetical protein
MQQERSASKPVPHKVAFIVEGDTDQVIVEALARKILDKVPGGRSLQLTTLPVYGSPRVRNVFPEIYSFLREGFERVIVVFDADSADEDEVEAFVDSLRARLVQEDLDDAVTLVAVAPEIEGWLLADPEIAKEVLSGETLRGSPKEMIERLLKKEPLQSLVAHLHPERIREKDQSFRAFERSLREVAERQAA